MTIEVQFRLEDRDLDYFRNAMKSTQENNVKLPETVILNNARALYESISAADIPEFVDARLHKLKMMIEMIEDPEWNLPEEEHNNILSALGYFTEAKDLVSDHIPVIGYLDDAIIIELVSASLTDSIKSYEEFCIFRKCEKARNGGKYVSKMTWLNDKRHEKLERVRRRHSRSHSSIGSFSSIF